MPYQFIQDFHLGQKVLAWRRPGAQFEWWVNKWRCPDHVASVGIIKKFLPDDKAKILIKDYGPLFGTYEIFDIKNLQEWRYPPQTQWGF